MMGKDDDGERKKRERGVKNVKGRGGHGGNDEMQQRERKGETKIF